MRDSFRASGDVHGLVLPGEVAKPLVRALVQRPGGCRYRALLAAVPVAVRICDRLWRAPVAASAQCPVSAVDATDNRCRATPELPGRRSHTSRLHACRKGLQTVDAPQVRSAPCVPQTRPLAHSLEALSRRAARTQRGWQTVAHAASMPSGTSTTWSLRADRRFAVARGHRRANRPPQRAASIHPRRVGGGDGPHPGAASRCCLRPGRKG